MLTVVKAYSSWPSAPTLPLDALGMPETDLIQIRNIEGLDPVKASITTSLFGSVDGASYTGGNVPSRNIVLTVHPNPDWDLWTHEKLRKLLYSYFMPKRPTRLVFENDNLPPVEISGIVEDISGSLFSKDPEYQISIICPDPYFTSINPIVVTGQAVRAGQDGTIINYKGDVEAGFKLKVTSITTPTPTVIAIGVQIGDPPITTFTVNAEVDSSLYFEMSSVQMKKYVQNVSIGSGIITNLLAKVREGSKWPAFQSGDNELVVVTDQGTQDWELTYYERFGGL
jgi:hypothetical protein